MISRCRQSGVCGRGRIGVNWRRRRCECGGRGVRGCKGGCRRCRVGGCGSGRGRRRQGHCEGQGERRALAASVAHGHFDFVLAIAQLLSRDGKGIVFDGFRRSAVVGYLDAGDLGLAAGLDLDILIAVQNGVDGNAAQLDSRRQGRDLKFNGLHGFGAGGIDSAHGDGIASRRQVSCIQREIQPIAFYRDDADIGFKAQAYDWRLTQRQYAAAKRVRDHGVRVDAFDFQARRHHFHIENLLDRRALSGGIDGTDGQHVFFRAELKGIKVEFKRRLPVHFHHFAIDDELDLGNLCLSARLNRNHFGVDDLFLRRRLEVVRYARRQGGDFKFLA